MKKTLRNAIITLGGIIVLLWLILLAIMVFVEEVIMNTIRNSTLRTIIGLSLYFLWVAIIYFLFKTIVKIRSTKEAIIYEQ